MKHKLYVGDVTSVLKELPDNSIHCAVTSPPYHFLRDYGLPPTAWPEVTYTPMPGLTPITVPAWEGCLGLEPSPEIYVAHLVHIFRELRRVLRDDGTFWLNLGDGYASKNLTGIPWRVAFALQADGWWLRADNIWHKVNVLPESVRDRPVAAHEHVFLLAKNNRYYYDADAIREITGNEADPEDYHRNGSWDEEADADRHLKLVRGRGKTGPTKTHPKGRNKRTVWDIPTRPCDWRFCRTCKTLFQGAEARRLAKRGHDRVCTCGAVDWLHHSALFPDTLVGPCLKAGTSAHGVCPACGAPWRRVVERTAARYNEAEALRQRERCAGVITGGVDKVTLGCTDTVTRTTVGWEPTCGCGREDVIPATVLDPFGGSGTVSLVAERLGLNSVYIDLSLAYAEVAAHRLQALQAEYEAWEVGQLPRQPLFSVTKKDLRIETYRCSGKGGQNINKREMGVRIRYPESGAVGQACDERSQHQNRKLALKLSAKSTTGCARKTY